jgi:membrane-associated phospholipid phosphatase
VRATGRGYSFLLATLTVYPAASVSAQTSPTCKLGSAPARVSTIAGKEAEGGQPLCWKEFPSNALADQKRIWSFPAVVVHGHHWVPAAGFTLAAAGLVALDPHETPYFRRTQTFADFNRALSSQNTGLGEGLFPVAFFLAGRVHNDAYTEKTALLAGEALANAEIVSEVMKNVDRRLRPREIPPDGDFTHTWFKAGGGILINRGSFPSGHAIGAFAMATVIAERYHQHRWVPWMAYGLAGVVGFSRITLQAHFPSDIFAGAVLGYSISHFVVLRNRDGAP